ncbi:MAG: hypothetical protein IJE77_10335 [Thermoguttaceae bacterium]|nr:hypothetical protein [Thermoguttaceae bacterium]
MRQKSRKGAPLFAACCAVATFFLPLSADAADQAASKPEVAKKVINLDKLDAMQVVEPVGVHPYNEGFVETDGVYVCDAGDATDNAFGVARRYVLNQETAAPIVATGWSRAENVGGSGGADYSRYIDLEYADGQMLWGQTAPFATGDSDWTQERVAIFPEKPIKSLTFYGLFRNRSGKASFRDLELREMKLSNAFYLFDGVPVERGAVKKPTSDGSLLLRDAAKNGDFWQVAGEVHPVSNVVDGIRVSQSTEEYVWSSDPNAAPPTRIKEIVLENLGADDRALTLVYSIRVPKTFEIDAATLRWLDDPRRERLIGESEGEFIASRSVPEIGGGRLSHYPIGGVACGNRVLGLGVDPNFPAFYRIAFNAASRELYIAFDVALTAEKPTAELRFAILHVADAAPGEAFRALLDAYCAEYRSAFVVRAPNQGNWQPFAPISKVPNQEDFGFQFKEGNDEIAYDDSIGVTTFRYTEPMTWWQSLPAETPKTIDAALELAKKQAADGNAAAQALLTSGHRDRDGKFCARFLDTPWCDGAVWSLNDAPGLVKLAKEGKLGDAKVPSLGGFETKWNEKIADDLYGPALPASDLPKTPADFAAAQSRPGLDGEYIDSSEGYVTALLDFDRSHFAGMRTPLVFDAKTKRPAIYRGLIAFEYVEKIASDVRKRGRLAMANSTPGQFFWLVPQLDVVGTETNWNWNDRWSPMSDADLLYRRALCYGKPYCFLMNTDFEKFGADYVEKYMKRVLAYGMFPGFFSADASTKHYFLTPALYERDRPLFKKYMPLCKAVAEAGWEARTGATSSDEKVYVERFGRFLSPENRPQPTPWAKPAPAKSLYFTVFNDSQEEKTFEIAFGGDYFDRVQAFVDRVSGKTFELKDRKLTATLASEDVMVLEPVYEER